MKLILTLFFFSFFASSARAECTFRWPCFDPKPSVVSSSNFQQMISRKKVEKFATIKSLYYADLKIDCKSTGLLQFARRFVEKSWNIGLIREDRDLALTVEVEKILGANQAPAAIATFPVLQVTKAAGQLTEVAGCNDFVATNLPFDVDLRLKFKLLQSKQAKIPDATYAAFRLFSRFIGFVVGGGPEGAALVTAAANVSTKVSESKSDIDLIVSSFDEVQTSKPQIVFEKDVKSITVEVDGGASFILSRVGKRSVFLEFAGDVVQNSGAAFDGIISQNTALNLSSYLDQKAPAWKSLLPSSDLKNAVEGCTNLRNALRVVFTEEERAVLLARLISDFGAGTINTLKEPCLHAAERAMLKTFNISDPLPRVGNVDTNSSEPRSETRDNTDRLRWTAIERFLDEFGALLARLPQMSPDQRSTKLGSYFDARIATESFDSPDLLPTSNGAQRENVASKLASWPFGKMIRFGCFMRPPKVLSEKFSGQMLIEFDSGGAAPKLVNLIVGFTDRETTEVEKLVIGNLMIEVAMTGIIGEIKKSFPNGCGDRSDRWRPWDGRLTAAVRSGSNMEIVLHQD
ncbi:hypothetical protein ACQR1I_21885 [Bradyrhizobium sp. HKCCYLS2038]|uniref:hypothetical protein n=1 Tax=unclassified Bradyrhizobium TaxID=2631580 RepID=UPI003EB985BC